MSLHLKHLYEFGTFRLDATERLLLCGGRVVPLTPKTFDLLLALVSQPNRLLTKEELLRAVWPDTVVEESNLTTNIAQIRKALGEGENGLRFIETVPKRGYRFVAEVREVGEETRLQAKGQTSRVMTARETELVGSDQSATQGAASRVAALANNFKHNTRTTVIARAILFVVGAAILYVAFFIHRRLQASPPPQRVLSRVTFDAGLQSEPTWSPDGLFIAYSSDRNGNFDVWVKPVAEGDPVQVTKSSAHDWQPDWSPDGSKIVFRSEREGGALLVVPALGGVERKISSFGYRPRWSPDGSQILFYGSPLPTFTPASKIYVVSLDGNPPREVLVGRLREFDSGEISDVVPRLSWHPDGQRISLWGRHLKLGWGFWTIPLATL